MIKFTEHKCIRCGYELYKTEFVNRSQEKYGFILCPDCQTFFEKNQITPEARQLYKALRERNVPVDLEVFDGYKTIDMVVKPLKLNIEVDGMHHAADSKQALADLKRAMHSYKKGYTTIHIPNCLIHERLDETADSLVEILFSRRDAFQEKKGQDAQLAQLKWFVDYLLFRLDILFSVDWEYSKDMFGQILPETGHTFYSYPEGANWQNRDDLMQAIQQLRDYLNEQSNNK